MSAIQPEKALLVIPTYNEALNIRGILESVWAALPTLHVLVVDDSSKDGTADIVRSLQDVHPYKLFLHERSGKLGLGTAYIAGFNWGLERGYEAYMEMDADFSHDPKELKPLLEKLEHSDVVIGSRYIPGGGTENWNWFRKLISISGSYYARMILSLKIRDLTGGFNSWRAEVLRRIDLDTIRSEGYSFQIELKYRASNAGFRLIEHPILFSERREGQSKMSGRIVVEALLRVWGLRWARMVGPKRPPTSRVGDESRKGISDEIRPPV